MCGIAGIITYGSPHQRDALHGARVLHSQNFLNMLDSGIAHRGPDGQGRFSQSTTDSTGQHVSISFQHRRLSILDHAGGHQPMTDQLQGVENSTIALVFNGCIYNHRALRAQLVQEGAQFRTDHSDTEVIVQGWRIWGRDLLPRLEGMFALAIWDQRTGEVVLARDPAGEKPLYILRGNGFVAFASTLSPLLALHDQLPEQLKPVKAKPNLAGWLMWGFGSVSDLCEAEELAPNTAWSNQHGHWTIKPQVAFQPHSRQASLSISEVQQLLEASVAARIESDVPLGAFLSGGVDSSLVSLLAHRIVPGLETFCVSMPSDFTSSPRTKHAGNDESIFAQHAAKIIGSKHHTLPCEATPAADLIHLITQTGLPLGDSSLLPTYWVSKAARAHIKVALSGDGADELFLGYDRHFAQDYLARYGRAMAAIPKAVIDSAFSHPKYSRLRRLIAASKGHGYPQIAAIFDHLQLKDLIGPASWDLTAPILETWKQVGCMDAPDWDFYNYLPGDLLRKVDTASMAVALEVRAPFLDSALMQACLHAKLEVLAPNQERKGLLRAVAAQFFPRELVDRPKQGFSIPLAEWFRSDYGGLATLFNDAVFASDAFPAERLGFEISQPAIRKLFDLHRAGTQDHAQRLYMLMVLAVWCRWRSGLRNGITQA